MSNQWHSQFDVAKKQLDRAIKLFVDEKDYYSSATLAGASEEILGKIIESNGGTNALNMLQEYHKELLTKEEYREIDGEKGLISNLNEYRNWLKHYSENGEIFINSEEAAFELISRAIDNYLTIENNSLPEIITRFIEYSSSRHA